MSPSDVVKRTSASYLRMMVGVGMVLMIVGLLLGVTALRAATATADAVAVAQCREVEVLMPTLVAVADARAEVAPKGWAQQRRFVRYAASRFVEAAASPVPSEAAQNAYGAVAEALAKAEYDMRSPDTGDFGRRKVAAALLAGGAVVDWCARYRPAV